MPVFLNTLSVILLVFALFVVALNWLYVAMNGRRRRAGIPGHVSLIPLVAPLLAGLAFMARPANDLAWLPAVYSVVVCAADPALWELFLVPFTRRQRGDESR